MMDSISKKVINISIATLLNKLCAISVKAQYLKAEEIIAKHRDSIGTKEKRANLKTIMAIAAIEFIIKVLYSKTLGKHLSPPLQTI